jgi:predicted nucleotidyltransferase/DNA-binding transcriptional ArsR family regulator
MLDRLLGSKTRARVLARLLLDERRYRLLELQRAVGTSVSSVQKELVLLESLGLVVSEREGDARFVSAVRSHPLAGPLVALLEADHALGESLSQSDIAPRLNPVVAGRADAIAAACRRSGAMSAALVGSATQPDPAIIPADLDVLVRFPPEANGYASRYFALLEELEQIMGMPVEIIDEDGVTNPFLREEFEATKVVLYEAA